MPSYVYMYLSYLLHLFDFSNNLIMSNEINISLLL